MAGFMFLSDERLLRSRAATPTPRPSAWVAMMWPGRNRSAIEKANHRRRRVAMKLDLDAGDWAAITLFVLGMLLG
jgi:hypothetical protein